MALYRLGVEMHKVWFESFLDRHAMTAKGLRNPYSADVYIELVVCPLNQVLSSV